MSKKSVLKMSALAVAFAAAAAPITAAAEVTGSMGISNIYLWRGQDLTAGGAAAFGGLEYGHESGLYTGVWGSSESGTSEYDLYVGYGTELGDISVDLSYWAYIYPNDGNESDFAEVVLSLGVAGFEFGAYFGVGEENDKDNYFTLGYSYEAYGITVGTWSLDDSAGEYTHVDLSYAFNDNLSFAVSKIVDEKTDGAYDKDLLFFVSYEFSF